MADINTRIEQFQKMAHDDPDNELGHYSLGRAYLEAGRLQEAIGCLERVISINERMSPAYNLLGSALLKLGRREEAIAALTRGVKMAHERGDIMPKNEMIKTLTELGAPLPELKRAEAERPVGEGEVHCQRCGKIGPKLPGPPFRNEQGKLIYEKICAPCWREWIGMGTKVINEMRLPLSDPQAQKIFDQHMMEFLNLR